MANETRKYLLDQFQTHLSSDFEDFCERHNLAPSTSGFITFLIDHELILKTNILRYTVLKEIARMAEENGLNKTQAASLLAHRFNISERTVWNILRGARG